VEYFHRISAKEWRLVVLTKPDELLNLEPLVVTIPLNQIYRNVTWET
jgi:hypothetical protein